MNALAIFLPETHSCPPYLEKIEPLTHRNGQKADSNHSINNEDVAECLKKSGMLEEILKMQLIYVSESDFREINY